MLKATRDMLPGSTKVKLRILLAACVLMAAGVCAAEDDGVPKSDQPVRVRLLDEVPDYGSILKNQWSTTVRPETFESEAAHYGLLRENATQRPITLEESIALALENNTGLRIQMLSPIAATARVREAWAQFDPAAFGNAGKNRSLSQGSTISVVATPGATMGQPAVTPLPTPGSTVNLFTTADVLNQEVDWNLGLRKELLTGGRLSLQWTNARLSSIPSLVNQLIPQYASTLGFSLTQPLLRDFGWRFALLIVDAAQISEEQAFYDYKAQVANLIASVEQAYWVYVLAIENVRVEEKGLDLAKELLRQNEGRFKVGALPRTSVLESEAEVARREANLVRARALQRISRDNLRALVNARDANEDALIMIEPADKPTVVSVDLDLDHSLEVAYKDRPELVAARLNVDGRKVDRKIAENRLLPRLDFVGGAGLNGLGGDSAHLPQVPFNGVVFEPNPNALGSYNRSLEQLTSGRFYQYQFGAVVEVPLDNAEAKARYAEAKVNSESARLSLSQVEENVTLEITQSVNNLKAYLKSIEATRIARELAEENVRNQQARYDVGLATTKDLIDFTERLTEAQRAEIEALTNYNIEVARLRRADGSLLRDRNVLLERNGPEPPPWWARF
jgi:outer membrane protein TolC